MGKARLEACFDDYTVPSEGSSVSADVQGDVLDAMEQWLPADDNSFALALARAES